MLNRLYQWSQRIVVKREDERFLKQSKAMVQPCGKIFPESDVHDVIISGANRMRSDGFCMISDRSQELDSSKSYFEKISEGTKSLNEYKTQNNISICEMYPFG